MKYKLLNELSHNPQMCLEELLMSRGVEEVEGYIYPSQDYELKPDLLDNIDDAALLLLTHLKNKDAILLVVDSDADGFCSSAMMYNYIKHFFPEITLDYICHEHKAHGLDDIINQVLESDYDLIICPDASSFDIEEHKLLKENGKTVLVIDHHDAPEYSPYATVVNNQLSEKYYNKGLCGAGVVYKFLTVMDQYLNSNNHSKEYLDLCALANVADCMSPTNLETRYYITEGLKPENIKNEGFKAFIKAQEFSLSKAAGKDMDYMKVAFYIAPLINAITRVGTMDEKHLLFEAFIHPNDLVQSGKRGAKEGDMEKVAVEAARIATNARARQNRIKEKAEELLDYRIHKFDLLENKIIVIEVYEEDKIPQELTGLLATQFVSKYGRPCMVVRRNEEGLLQGSLRGNENFQEVPDFKSFLLNSGIMNYVEGHPNAAGVGVHEKNLDSLLAYANSQISEEGLENIYGVDYIFNETENFTQLAINLASDPSLWGNDVYEPKVVVENVPVSNLFIMGADKSSVKWSHNGVEYVRFKDTDFIDEVQQYDRCEITVYGTLAVNEWAGRKTPQIRIEDWSIRDTSDDF